MKKPSGKTFTKSTRQETGRQMLFTLARNVQTTLDDLTMVAAIYGLKASDVVEAFANRFNQPEPLIHFN